MTEKPIPKSSLAEKELNRLDKQFQDFDSHVKDLTKDRMDMAPVLEVEPQTKMSQEDIEKARRIYLKPAKSVSSREPFNEKFRADYEYQKEYVQFIAENKEVMGDKIETWTKPFPGMAAEFWEVPPNKPVWGPRYLAERIKGCSYHRLSMELDNRKIVSGDAVGQYFGQMVADNIVQRLDAIPVSNRKSIFMGAAGF